MIDTAPTRVRWRIATLLFAISVVTYIDRVNISVTARQMMPALGLTDLQMGQVFSAFVFGYALFQIPGGWLGDRWGAKRVLTLAIIWWSLFTALTAVAAILPLATAIGALGSLILVRFLVGIGEAAALPTSIAPWPIGWPRMSVDWASASLSAASDRLRHDATGDGMDHGQLWMANGILCRRDTGPVRRSRMVSLRDRPSADHPSCQCGGIA